MKNTKTAKRLRMITTAAIIAALYTALTTLTAPISFGPVQVRISEALTVLPALTPAAIPGVAVGCLISNLVAGNIWDVVFGTLATLIGAIGTWLIGKKYNFLSPIPPILANTVIIPWVLKFAYTAEEAVPLLLFSIGAGEVISCGVLGLILLYSVRKTKVFKEL